VQTRNRLSLAYLTVNDTPPVEHIEAAAAGGFDVAGLRIVAPSHLKIDYGIVGNRERIREINRAKERTGVGVLDIEICTLDADTDIDRFVPALETSAELGASFVQSVCEDLDRARAIDNFARLCDAAAQFGLRIALEFMRFRRVQTVEAASELVRTAGRANGGVLIDAMHLARSGGDPGAVAALPREQIAYMQLCDARGKAPPLEELAQESRNDRLLPGEGDLWLDALFDALPDDIPISVEVPRSVDRGRSARERAVIAGDAARRYLARYRARET